MRGAVSAGGLSGTGAPYTLEAVSECYLGEALLAVAARVGTTRLIDNTPLVVGPGGGRREVFSPEIYAAQ